jgi:glutamate-ammonia-ligase adenylyltransferase
VRDHPDLISPTTRIALANLRDAGVLAAEDAALLIRADRVWRTIQGLLRISAGWTPAARLSSAPEAALLHAARAAGAFPPGSPTEIDLPGLQATLQTLADRVSAAFTKYVGEIRT